MTYKKTTKIAANGKKENVGKTDLREVPKFIPPNVDGMCFILKTQRRDKWAKRQEVDNNTQGFVVTTNDGSEYQIFIVKNR